jgi:hypothetical protein
LLDRGRGKGLCPAVGDGGSSWRTPTRGDEAGRGSDDGVGARRGRADERALTNLRGAQRDEQKPRRRADCGREPSRERRWNGKNTGKPVGDGLDALLQRENCARAGIGRCGYKRGTRRREGQGRPARDRERKVKPWLLVAGAGCWCWKDARPPTPPAAAHASKHARLSLHAPRPPTQLSRGLSLASHKSAAGPW